MKNKINRIASGRIEGERKNVTIIFANISGSTPLSEQLDPKALDSLFKVLMEIVYNYEGTLNKVSGDCLKVVFGALITHEDDPARAVYSGLEMMDVLDQFNEEHGTDFSIHIGINSGVVTVKGVDPDFTVTGNTVDFAEQLMRMAKHEILASKNVYKSTSYLFEMQGFKPVRIKAKKTSVIPYRVIGMKQAPGRKHGISELYSPLIGRDEEITLMKMAVHKVIKGKAAVVSINGEAGVGKTRLIEEFRKNTRDKVTWLSGRCPSYGEFFPFYVFLEQIRSYLGLSDFDLEMESSKKLGEKAQSLLKDKMNEYLPYLSVFLSIKVLEHLQEKVKYLDPESLRLQEFISVKALLRDIAKAKPLILYFEDMHWIDPESLELIKFLLDGLEDTPIFFLFETRPEQETGIYKIKGSIQKIFKNRYTEINLKTLRINDSKALIQNLLSMSKPPQDISALILEKSEGNPFYIEEITRSFIESGILKRDNGSSWRLTKGISSFEIPGTVDAVVRSRIDRLSIGTKEVLGRASVIGKTFLYKILSYISEKDHLRKKLGFLETRDFILKKNGFSTTLKLFPDTEYIFKHILIRDVAYKGLLKKKRREIHKKVAECTEKIFKEKIADYFEVLAYHYYHAEDFKKSYDYYKKAGDEAKERYNNNIAIESYTKAIEIHRKLDSENKRDSLAELFEKRGDVNEVKAEYDNAIKDYKDAFGYYKNVEAKAGVKRKTGNIYFQKGEYDKAISSYEKAMNMLKGIPESPVLLETRMDYVFLLSEGKSDYTRAEKMIEHTLEKTDKKKQKKIYAQGSNTLGGILRHKGEYDKSLKHRRATLAIYEELKDKRAIGRVCGNIGIVYYNKGKFEAALKCHKRALVISEEIGDKKGISKACCNMGIVYHDKGEIETALRYYKKDLALSEEIGDKSGIGVVSGNIGSIYYDKGELDTALRYFRGALFISEEIGDKKGIALTSGNIGNIYCDKGELDTALRYFRGALSISEEIGDKKGIGIACFSIGGVYIEIKRFDDTRKYLERSEQIIAEIGDRVNLSEVFSFLSLLNTVQQDYESAIKFAEKALSLAKETGAQPQEVLVLRTLAKALLKQNPEKAISYCKQSISIAKKQKMLIEYAKSLYELAKILKNTGKIKDAKKYLNEAKEIFKKSGATGWLEKVKQIKF